MSKKSKLNINFKLLAALSTAMLVGVCVSFGPSMAQYYSGTINTVERPEGGLAVPASLNAALDVGRIGGREFMNPQAMQVFYEQRAQKPYWSGGFFKNNADEFMRIIERSWTHGLNPARYHVNELKETDGALSFMHQTERELLLTDAFIRYVHDISGMRIDPEGLRVDAESWRQPLSATAALDMLASGKDIKRIVVEIEPQSRTYKMLQAELVRLSQQEEEPYIGVLPLKFDRLVRPAERHERIPDLRMRLGVEPYTNDELLYDDRLAAAIIKFQRENGLLDDGIIGSETLEILNRTKADLMLQLIANMERLRWVEEDRPDKFVVVNIPSATLWAIDDRKVEFEMPVIVGRPVRPTESFITEIRGVRFNPDWTVPPTIKRSDMLPKLLNDPQYFADKGIEIFDGQGADAPTIDPAAVDWENISWPELNRLRMVQTPGKHNALGQVRVLMNNKFNIYLHDTNHPELFEKQARALSSGCIRLKEPLKMASFIMRDRPGWDSAEMHSVLNTGRTKDISIPDNIPVYILYYTTWVDADGRVVFGSDIYNQDKKLIRKLAKVDGFSIPGHNIKMWVSSDPSEVASVK